MNNSISQSSTSNPFLTVFPCTSWAHFLKRLSEQGCVVHLANLERTLHNTEARLEQKDFIVVLSRLRDLTTVDMLSISVCGALKTAGGTHAMLVTNLGTSLPQPIDTVKDQALVLVQQLNRCLRDILWHLPQVVTVHASLHPALQPRDAWHTIGSLKGSNIVFSKEGWTRPGTPLHHAYVHTVVPHSPTPLQQLSPAWQELLSPESQDY